MSATVTGTGVTVFGVKVFESRAITPANRATPAIAAAKASTSGRAGRPMGSGKPKRGLAAGAANTRWNARGTSSGGSVTAKRLAMECASPAMLLKRAWHSAHSSRWTLSARATSGSSTIRRSVPSVRCATSDLLAQSCFRASQQSSNLSDTDAERLGDLGVAEAAGSQHEHRGRPGRHPAERRAQVPAILIELGLLLRVELAFALLLRMSDLPLLPAPRAAQPVQRSVRRGPMEPRGRVIGFRRVQPVEVDEDLLGHVLRFVRVGQNPVRDADDAGVFRCEEGLESGLFRRGGGHPTGTQVHCHCSSSTARRGFMTNEAGGALEERPAPDPGRQEPGEDEHGVDALAALPLPVHVAKVEKQRELVQRERRTDAEEDGGQAGDPARADADLQQPHVPDQEQEQDAPHQVMDMEPAAGRHVVERADTGADHRSDRADDAERDEKGEGGEEEPLAALVAEMERIKPL